MGKEQHIVGQGSVWGGWERTVIGKDETEINTETEQTDRHLQVEGEKN